GQTTVVDAAWERAKTAQLREAFVVESSDILQANDLTLRRWRQNTANQELLTDLCRDIQTLRNNARMAGVTSVADVAGSLVALLEAVGSGQIEAGDETIGAIEQSLDGLSQMLDALRQGIVPGKADHLLGLLQNQLQGAKSEQTQVAPSSPRPTLTSAPVVSESIRVDTSLLQSLSNQVGESSIYQSRVEQGVGAFQFNLNELDQTIGRLRLQLRRLEINAEAQILFRREEAGKQHGRDFDPLELDRFSELQHLTRSLMEIVDDLGNVQQTLDNQIYSVNQLLHEQHKVNREVQDSLVRTRMVRFASVVPRLRRVIRQVAGELDKQAELKIDNHDELIDRNVLENMIAPMEHMLRNALDHGIETPEIRRAAGKPETGTITLGIGREGAEIVFELKDDGAGLDFDAIRAKAESRGMLMPGQEVDEAKLVNLLLQPGFSTAKKVTQISGRGVGMDVVNEGIRALRGTLRIRSQAGQGTRFTVRLPFSLEQTQALLVRVKNDVYAVPLLSIEAVDRLAEGELRTYLAGDPVEHSYGENPYPVHGMGVLFGYEPLAFEEVEDPQPPVLLFRSDEAAAALQVDDVLGRAEIVLKAVAPQVGMVPGVAGATVLADGRVAVVLDLAAVVRNMATLEGVDALIPQVQTRTDERPEVLVVDDSITMRKVTSRLLERHDFRVALAKDGLEAVAQLDSTAPPVLVIMDIEMPRMDGFEVLAHIRNQPRLRHLPVIMVTSRSGDKHRSRARQLGASDYLIKPYRDEDLLASIHKVLPEVSPA
ncbi:MAG: response regulator, partial [Candidatus Competibacterales bacterium]|nr:response regulator [Candidatus Competibacterales bacterium]